MFIGLGATIASSILSLLNPSVGVIISTRTALITSVAFIITIGYISKLKIRFTKLRDWINVISLVFEQTLKQWLIDRKLMKKKHRT